MNYSYVYLTCINLQYFVTERDIRVALSNNRDYMCFRHFNFFGFTLLLEPQFRQYLENFMSNFAA